MAECIPDRQFYYTFRYLKHMKRTVVILVLFLMGYPIYAQNELSRVNTESLWYTCEEEYAHYNLILCSGDSDLSLKSNAKQYGYDGAAIFSRYDVKIDKEATLHLLYKIDRELYRICLYLDASTMPFYVKFNGGKARVYELNKETHQYSLGVSSELCQSVIFS